MSDGKTESAGLNEKEAEFIPTGVKRVYFDVKGGIDELEVLKETPEILLCWDEDEGVAKPVKIEHLNSVVWATKEEAIKCAIERLTKYVKGLQDEIELFKTM